MKGAVQNEHISQRRCDTASPLPNSESMMQHTTMYHKGETECNMRSYLTQWGGDMHREAKLWFEGHMWPFKLFDRAH